MAKKGRGGSSRSEMYLLPVSLKEPVLGKLKVVFWFSPYSDRINGRS